MTSQTCVVAMTFRLPPTAHPHRWYSTRDLALLWNLTPGTIIAYRYRARRLGYPPHPDQFRVHRLNAARRYVLIRSDYAAILETLLPQLGTPPKKRKKP